MAELKDLFLLDPQVVFLNHGSFGATPAPVFQEYQRWQRELERQPVEFLGRRFAGLMEAVRERLGAYLGARADHLVFMQNATIALNLAARSLDLGPDDEVLSSTHEYGAIDRTWRYLSTQRGFGYIHQDVPLPLDQPSDFVEAFWSGVTARTRVICLSHITSPTALVLPVEAVVQRARRAGILTVIDGAHTPGQIPLRLDDLGADFYAGNLHKWLCAPKGAGFLYARPEAQRLLKPLVVSWGYEPETPGPSPFIDYNEWWGTRDPAAFLAVPAAIDFLEAHDWDQVRRACRDLAGEAQQRIAALTGLAPLHSPDRAWYRQMIAAPLPADSDLAALKTALYDAHRIEVPLTAWNGYKLIRVSVQGYNTRADIDRLVEALQELLKGI